MPKKERPEVKIGQCWKDCDKRTHNRVLRVVDLEGDHHALCHVVGTNPVRKVRIAVARMHPHSTGYELIQECQE